MKNLETSRLIIRSFTMEDVEDAYNNWAKDEKAYRVNFRKHRSIEETRSIVQSCITESELGEPVWALEEKETGLVVGYVRTLEMSTINKTSRIGFGIGYKWCEKQYIEEALLEVFKYLFFEEEFELLYVKLYNENNEISKAKRNILLNVGMEKEATLKRRRINKVTNEVEDLNVYSLTKEDFLKFIMKINDKLIVKAK